MLRRREWWLAVVEVNWNRMTWCANQQIDLVEDCPGAELNGQFLEIFEKLPYLGDTIRARGSEFDSVTTRIRSEWSMFRDLVSLLASGGFPIGAKGIYCACARSIKLYGIETWPVKEEDEIRLERNDTNDYRIGD